MLGLRLLSQLGIQKRLKMIESKLMTNSSVANMFMRLVVDCYNECLYYIYNKEEVDRDSRLITRLFVKENQNKMAMRRNKAIHIKMDFKANWDFLFGGDDYWLDDIAYAFEFMGGVSGVRNQLLKAKRGVKVGYGEPKSILAQQRCEGNEPIRPVCRQNAGWAGSESTNVFKVR